MGEKKRKLTKMQKAFVDVLLADPKLNITESAIKAGYSENSAGNQGWKTLQLPHVQEYMDKQKKKREKRIHIDQDRVIEEFSHVAFSDIADFLKIRDMEIKEISKTGNVKVKKKQIVELNSLEDMPESARRAIKSIKQSRGTISLELYNKIDALKSLGDHLGMFDKDINVTGEDGLQVLFNIARPDRSIQKKEKEKAIAEVQKEVEANGNK